MTRFTFVPAVADSPQMDWTLATGCAAGTWALLRVLGNERERCVRQAEADQAARKAAEAANKPAEHFQKTVEKARRPAAMPAKKAA